ncbi:Ku protein [Sporolactobacillus sp. THM7-7]|nr:Ku protein [Sporolactobacillus sp. THM7-7]
MRTMWKGAIRFGLVYIPIKLYTATENKDVRLRMLHKDCMAPVSYTRTCTKCGKAIQNEDIIKGYEYAPEQFVAISEEEIHDLQDDPDKSIEIVNFVNLNEIDPIYFEKSYFIGPDTGTAAKAYALLREAIESTNKIGIANIILRQKQHLAAIRSYGNGLIMETLYYPDEVRSVSAVPGIGEIAAPIEKKELNIAAQLIDQLTETFKPENYKDDYREKLEKLIADKVAGIKPEKKEPARKSKDVIDLLSALEASVKETKPKKRTARRRKTS